MTKAQHSQATRDTCVLQLVLMAVEELLNRRKKPEAEQLTYDRATLIHLTQQYGKSYGVTEQEVERVLGTSLQELLGL
jgi:hypothetical protein